MPGKIEDPQDKYTAFEKSIIIPDPSRIVKKPYSIEELVSEQTLLNIMQYKLQLEIAKAARKLQSDMDMKLMYGWTEDQIKKYPLSQQEAFQKGK